jgi:hypothetical protein
MAVPYHVTNNTISANTNMMEFLILYMRTESCTAYEVNIRIHIHGSSPHQLLMLVF